MFEKHLSGLDLKTNFALHVLVLLCLLLPFQTISISLLQPQAFMLHFITDMKSHSVPLNDTVTSSPKSNSLSLFLILSCPLFTSSDSCCLNFSPDPSSSAPLLSVSQRKSWTWTRVTGKTFMSSQELWNYSFASFPSPWCPSASSPTLWRQSVSEQLRPHSICLFCMNSIYVIYIECLIITSYRVTSFLISPR